MSMFALAPENRWVSIELMKHRAIGHEVDSLGQFFESLTVHDCAALSQAIYDAGALGQRSRKPAVDVLKATQGSAHDRRDLEEDERSDFWDIATGTASFRTTFDPISNRRRDINANARYAFTYGVHPEEFQARCASRELPFPFAEEDAVALFIYASVHQHFRSQASAERFMRVYLGGKGCGIAVLFSVRTSVSMDAFGGISQVRLFL
jgi:hypothetical protein